MKKFLSNLKNSINGLKIMMRGHSFVAELIGGIILIPYIILSADIDITYKLIIIFTYVLLLVFEIVNTAIEKLCDKITKKYDKDIKAIKDISSASVFIILIMLLIIILSVEFYYN